MNVTALDYTSDRLNAQNTDVEIWYPWHPWYRRVVQLIRAVKRNGTSSCDVKAVYGDGIQVLSIPSWMCDRAACAAVRLDVVPKVNVESLRILRELLQAAVPRPMPDMVEDRHLKGPSLGDAYANPPTNASPSAGVIPPGGIAAHLAESPGSSKAANKRPLRTANRGVEAASKSANPEERGCQ